MRIIFCSFSAMMISTATASVSRVTLADTFASRLASLNPAVSDMHWLVKTNDQDLVRQYNSAISNKDNLSSSGNAFKLTVFSIMCKSAQIISARSDQEATCPELDDRSVASSDSGKVLDQLKLIWSKVFIEVKLSDLKTTAPTASPPDRLSKGKVWVKEIQKTWNALIFGESVFVKNVNFFNALKYLASVETYFPIDNSEIICQDILVLDSELRKSFTGCPRVPTTSSVTPSKIESILSQLKSPLTPLVNDPTTMNKVAEAWNDLVDNSASPVNNKHILVALLSLERIFGEKKPNLKFKVDGSSNDQLCTILANSESASSYDCIIAPNTDYRLIIAKRALEIDQIISSS